MKRNMQREEETHDERELSDDELEGMTGGWSLQGIYGQTGLGVGAGPVGGGVYTSVGFGRDGSCGLYGGAEVGIGRT
jgi:hypothetical protein